MAQQKFTISLLGFDERSAEILRHETRKTMSIVDTISKDNTQVVVVDIDEPNGISIWHEFRKQWPHMPAVVAASVEPDIDDASFAEKPFTGTELIDCITEAILLSPSVEETTSVASETSETSETSEASKTGEADDFIFTPFDLDAADAAPEETTSSEADEPADEPADELVVHKLESSTDVDAEAEDKAVADEESLQVIDTTEASDVPVKATPKKGMPSLSEIAEGLSKNKPSSNARLNSTIDTNYSGNNYFNPDEYMIGLILKGIVIGKESGAIIKLRCLLERTIYIDARNKLVRSNLSDIHLRQISIAPLGKGDSGLDTELETIDSKSFEALSDNDGALYSLETFVWELAILTSKGRVPVGTPLDKPTYLMQWPNFTRLKHIPNDMKVASYWLRMPSSLNDLSDNLNVPMNNLFLLYSAAYLTGLAGIAQRKADHLLKPSKPEQHKNRNLFGSIINKLSRQ